MSLNKNKTSKILHGDAVACLNTLDDDSITAAITSPPYWKQRDYKFKGQIGQEETSEDYIGHLVKVYSVLRKKLRKNGVFFLNIGDKYLAQYGNSHLMQIPYRLAYHMVKDGWKLQDIIIWYKPNHMPTSVHDRFANTYEPVLVLTKSDSSIYKNKNNVFKIALQQTHWKHTASFPEKLIEELLSHLELADGDIILDPFAGTGTTAVATATHSQKNKINLSSVMIEKGDEFVKIIEERAKITSKNTIKKESYRYDVVKEVEIPKSTVKAIAESEYGETKIVKNSKEFLSVLNYMTTDKFKEFHREDAVFFIGVKNWAIEDFYFASRMYSKWFVLRNMLVVTDKNSWYPVFMFVNDSTKIAYRFHLDRVRKKAKYPTSLAQVFGKKDFTGTTVNDITNKTSNDGTVTYVFKKYKDGFPLTVQINWKNGSSNIESVIHPENEIMLREGLIFKCRLCDEVLTEIFDPAAKNFCQSCGKEIWSEYSNMPKIEEPKLAQNLETKPTEPRVLVVGNPEDFTTIKSGVKTKTVKAKVKTSSKFNDLDRINWGASPGARSIMLDDSFSRMRLYKIEHPAIAKYLKLLRTGKKVSVNELEKKFPKSYKHTIGHWFRTDFGGSIPIPSDIPILREKLGDDPIWKILERTVLKLQTVKTSLKGKNPGDFIVFELAGLTKDQRVIQFLEQLYLPPSQYLKQG